MTEMTDKRKTLLLVAGGDRVLVTFSQQGGPVETGHVEARTEESLTDQGLSVVVGLEARAINWSWLVSVASTATERHVFFVDKVQPESELARLRSISAPLQNVVDIALRSWLGNSADLEAAARTLSAEDISALRPAAQGVLSRADRGCRSLLLALGVAGGAEDALALGDALCEIGETQDDTWRWTYGVEALRLLGTRDAHMQIQRVSMQSRNPPAIAAARQKLLHIAGDLRVPVWEVQDELVPSCGLDAQGGVDLSYGARRFELILDDHLTPLLLEHPGRERHRDLPHIEERDDAGAASDARQSWNIVREQIIEAVPVQVHRFEEALAQQTRWSGARWDRVLRRHPLLRHLMPRAIWGTYSKGGRKLVDTFRVAPDDHTLWGPDDEPYVLELDCQIGFPHPSEIPDDVRDAWGTVLADYEVVTMFPQIDRPVYRPAPERRKESVVQLDIHIPGNWALVVLHRRGWHEHQGWGGNLQKVFRNRDIKAVLTYRAAETEVVLETVSFERYLGFPQTNFQLRDTPEVPYTETLYELEQLRMPQETGGWPAVIGG